MKRLLLPLIAALALPNAVNANVDPEPQKLFNREEAKAAAREYHKKKGQFKDITDKPEVSDFIRGERGGLYEIRISSRTGKPYKHYF